MLSYMILIFGSDLQAFAEEMLILGANIEPWVFVICMGECICLVQCWIVKRYHWGTDYCEPYFPQCIVYHPQPLSELGLKEVP